MTIGNGTLVKLLSSLWMSFAGFVASPQSLVTSVLQYLGLGRHSCVEVVVDGTNRLYVAFGRALAVALAESGGQMPESPVDVDTFVATMARVVTEACRPVAEFAVAASATHIVLAFDKGKGDLALLDKWRDAGNGTRPDAEEVRKLRAFALDCAKRKGSGGGQWASSTAGEKKAAVVGILAKWVHRSACGKQLIRLVAHRLPELLKDKYPKLCEMSLVEAAEADVITLNNTTTYRAGQLVARDNDVLVAAWIVDADTATSPRMREMPLLNVDFPWRHGGRVLRARLDTTMQRQLLHRFVKTFADSVADHQLVFSPGKALTWVLRFVVMILTGFAMSDYRVESRRGISASLLETLNGERRPVPLEALQQLLRAYAGVLMAHARNGRTDDNLVDVSYAHLIWVAQHVPMAYFRKSHKRRAQLTRMVEALQDPDNQQQLLYGAYSRALTMVPLAKERAELLEALDKIFPADRMAALHASAPPQWRVEVATVNLDVTAVSVPDAGCVNGLLSLLLPPETIARVAAGRAPQQKQKQEQPPLIFKKVVCDFNVLREREAQDAARREKKKKPKVRAASAVVDRSAWPADADADVHEFNEFVKKLAGDVELADRVTQLADNVRVNVVTPPEAMATAAKLQIPFVIAPAECKASVLLCGGALPAGVSPLSTVNNFVGNIALVTVRELERMCAGVEDGAFSAVSQQLAVPDVVCDVCLQHVVSKDAPHLLVEAGVQQCESCVRVHRALQAHAQLRLLSRLLRDSPKVVVCLGVEARQAATWALAKVGKTPRVLFIADHVEGAPVFDTVFDSWTHALAELRVVLDPALPEGPLSHDDEDQCLAMLQALERDLVVERVVRRQQVKKRLARGTVIGSAGTVGLTAAGGNPVARGSDVAAAPAATSDVFRQPATRVGIPLASVASGAYAKSLPSAMQGAYAGELAGKLDVLLDVKSRLLLAANVADTCRAVAAAAGRPIVVFDAAMYKRLFFYICPLQLDSELKQFNAHNWPEDAALSMFGLPPELTAVLAGLRQFGVDTIVPKLEQAGLASCAPSIFFNPLADHLVTRVDVVVRSQLLSLLRTLLLERTNGATDSASLTLFFIFNDKNTDEVVRELTAPEVPDEPRVPDVASNSGNSGDDDELVDDDVFWDEDADEGDDDEPKRAKRNNALLLKAARGEYARLSEAMQRVAGAGGRQLHEEFTELRRKLQVDGQPPETEPYELWARLRDSWSLGAADCRAEAQVEPERKKKEEALKPDETGAGKRVTRPSKRFEAVEPAAKKPVAASKVEQESDRAAKRREALTRRLVRPLNANIAYVREVVLRKILEILPTCVGLRLAPLPSKSLPLHVRKSDLAIRPGLCRFLAPAAGADIDKVTLAAVFNVSEDINAVMYNGGGTFSTFVTDVEKTTATSSLKADPAAETVRLDTVYASPAERETARRAAIKTANARLAKDSVKPEGKPKPRVPVSRLRGCVTEKRFTSFVDATAEKSAFAKRPRVPPVPPAPPDPPVPPKSQFNINFDTIGELHGGACEKLEWLKQRVIAAFDPGLRWAVSGIVVNLLDYKVDVGRPASDDTEAVPPSVHLEFEYRRLRISGRKWQAYHYDERAMSGDELDAARHSVESIVNNLAGEEFLLAEAPERFAAVNKMFEPVVGASVREKMDAAVRDMLDKNRVHRKEARVRHQKELALQLVRHIDELAQWYNCVSHLPWAAADRQRQRSCGSKGDPIVLLGAAGGGGGRGRAQVNHDIIQDTLAGFFCVLLVDEFNTSRTTTCCHTQAHAPRKGRSRGCKQCGEHKDPHDPASGRRTRWWDRDTGASW